MVRAAGDPAFPLDEKEEAIAAWVYENRASAGRGMDTLPAGRGRYLPLVASGRALGVVGVVPEESGVAGEVLEGMARLGALESRPARAAPSSIAGRMSPDHTV